jgi:hypothetical protein
LAHFYGFAINNARPHLPSTRCGHKPHGLSVIAQTSEVAYRLDLRNVVNAFSGASEDRMRLIVAPVHNGVADWNRGNELIDCPIGQLLGRGIILQPYDLSPALRSDSCPLTGAEYGTLV